MRSDMLNAGLLFPEFLTEGTFAVIFRRNPLGQQETKKETTPDTRGKTRVKTRVKTKDLIIGLINQSNMITIPELAEMLGISDKGIEYQIARLKKDNILLTSTRITLQKANFVYINMLRIKICLSG